MKQLLKKTVKAAAVLWPYVAIASIIVLGVAWNDAAARRDTYKNHIDRLYGECNAPIARCENHVKSLESAYDRLDEYGAVVDKVGNQRDRALADVGVYSRAAGDLQAKLETENQKAWTLFEQVQQLEAELDRLQPERVVRRQNEAIKQSLAKICFAVGYALPERTAKSPSFKEVTIQRSKEVADDVVKEAALKLARENRAARLARRPKFTMQDLMDDALRQRGLYDRRFNAGRPLPPMGPAPR